MSMLSLEPAASTVGWLASIATAGSFCLFAENGELGLPTVTSVSALSAWALPIGATSSAATAPMTRDAQSRAHASPFWTRRRAAHGVVVARDAASVASVPTNKAFGTPSALQPASV